MYFLGGLGVKGIIKFPDLIWISVFVGADPRCGERTLFDHG